MESPFEVPSPCVGVCRIGRDGLCEGCLRSADEIAAWIGLDRHERLELLEALERRRSPEARKRA